MGKAGISTPNIRFFRSGLTIHQHVALAGEVIPLPPNFTPMTPKAQILYYGKVHYDVTSDQVNVGPTATAQFIRIAEPADEDLRGAPLQDNVVGKSSSETGGGGGQVSIPTAAQSAPDGTTVPGYEDKRVFRELAAIKRDEEDKARQAGITSTPDSSKRIVLKRQPIKRQKQLVLAHPTRLERKK